jgi:hypothetical protein
MLPYVGIQLNHIIEAILVGFGLTVLPYLGQLAAYYRDPELADPVFRFDDILWWRNVIVVRTRRLIN